jgi:hypothetical protein
MLSPEGGTVPPWSDLVVLFGIVLSTGWWVARLRRRGLRGRRFAAAAAVGLLGLTLVVTMSAHCLDVLSRLAPGTGYGGAAFVYNFRTYSLLLLGAVLIGGGVRLLRVSPSIGASPDARGRALRAILTVFALVGPLIPIHGFFAIPLSLMAAIALFLVLWGAPPVLRPAETVAAVAAIPG